MWTGRIINNKNREIERERRRDIERGTEGGVISTAHCKRKCWHELKDCRPGEHSCTDAPEIEKKWDRVCSGRYQKERRRMLEDIWQEVKVDYKTSKRRGQWATGSRARKAKVKVSTQLYILWNNNNTEQKWGAPILGKWRDDAMELRRERVNERRSLRH